MSTRPTPMRPQMTPIQRLAARLMRQRGFSLNQVARAIGASPTGVHTITRAVATADLPDVTLTEIGAPTDATALYTALLSEAETWLGLVLDPHEAARGQDMRLGSRP